MAAPTVREGQFWKRQLVPQQFKAYSQVLGYLQSLPPTEKQSPRPSSPHSRQTRAHRAAFGRTNRQRGPILDKKAVPNTGCDIFAGVVYSLCYLHRSSPPSLVCRTATMPELNRSSSCCISKCCFFPRTPQLPPALPLLANESSSCCSSECCFSPLPPTGTGSSPSRRQEQHGRVPSSKEGASPPRRVGSVPSSKEGSVPSSKGRKGPRLKGREQEG